ncbi:MAG: Inositol monophosphatase [Arenicellales bacterium IbO2]|nr:inositol monophosphatase [Gammaproteobacteria bacterium]MDA8012178.1 inositol monophosphatase [Gammaproteobacteria bacterium]CAJ2376178.1 MAG: Inositol monophosphatase [Arenicellales bacterium IbO2]
MSAAAPAAAHDAPPDLFALGDLVKRVALEEHAANRPAKTSRDTKPDGGWVTDLDRRIQERLLDELHRAWPGYGFIGEEMAHAEQRAVCESGAGYWVLDPLDGTTNFSSGFPFYGVSLALVADGAAQLGVVFDPLRRECFCAQAGRGAYLNRRRLRRPPPRPLGECIAVVDHKYLVGNLSERLVRSPPYRSQRNLGAAALEWCWLAADRAQLYLHGGQKLWDFAAGWRILTEAGGAATSLSGKPLDCARLRKRSVVASAHAAALPGWERWVHANTASPQGSPL